MHPCMTINKSVMNFTHSALSKFTDSAAPSAPIDTVVPLYPALVIESVPLQRRPV